MSSRIASPEERESHACDPAAELSSIAEMTRSVFGATPVIVPTADPESDADYLVVQVPAVGSDDEIAESVRTWHKRLADFTTEAVYCLSVVFD
jgi:hypothetical protein